FPPQLSHVPPCACMCAQYGHLNSSVAWQFVQNCTPSAFAEPHFGQVIVKFYLESAGKLASAEARAAHATTELSYYGRCRAKQRTLRASQTASSVAQVPLALTQEGSR